MNNQITIPELSVVILCYRAEDQAYDFVKRVEKSFKENDIKNYELVLVGNYLLGVKDKTPQIVKAIAQERDNIQFVAEPKKGMMGWDMKSGFKKARGKYLAIIDGDGQMPVGDIVRVYKKIKEKKAQFVKTYRLKRDDGLKRKTISFLYNLVFSVLFPGLKARDVNSKPKIMSRDLYQVLNLKSDDWFIDAEIMIKLRRFKTLVYEVPTEFHDLGNERQSFIKLPAIFEFIKNLVIYRIKEFKFRK